MLNTPKSSGTFSTIRRCIDFFPRKDRSKILQVTMIQSGLSFLDLLGVALIGILGAIAVNGISSRTPGLRTSRLLEAVNLQNSTVQTQVAILAGAASIFLISKTLISAFMARRISYFLSAKASHITSNMNKQILTGDLEQISAQSPMSLLYSLTTGVQSITTGVTASMVSITSDSFLLIVILGGLFLVDPIVAITIVVLFGGIGYCLYFVQQKRALLLGVESAELQVSSSRLLLEEISAFREIFVRNKTDHYEALVRNSRQKLSHNVAEMSFMPSISKYVMEIAIVLCLLTISSIQFVRTDAVNAVATLALFLAASSRFVPAMLRIQQSALTIRNSIGTALPTLELYDEISKFTAPILSDSSKNSSSPETSIELFNVSFHYEGKDEFEIKDINLAIKKGQFVAFIGPSGSGKSTVIDLLLGLLTPNEGAVKIMGLSPRDAISKYPGLIGYVPQSVYLKHGSISENVALGFSADEIDSEQVTVALRQARLSEYVSTLPQKEATILSEEGKAISGGQRQRLGIARAMYTNPEILVLDEATSALDGITEKEISSEIADLKGVKTLVVIAHRLSTIRNADIIYYLEEGRIQASGTFEELRSMNHNFAKQAESMGI